MNYDEESFYFSEDIISLKREIRETPRWRQYKLSRLYRELEELEKTQTFIVSHIID